MGCRGPGRVFPTSSLMKAMPPSGERQLLLQCTVGDAGLSRAEAGPLFLGEGGTLAHHCCEPSSSRGWSQLGKQVLRLQASWPAGLQGCGVAVTSSMIYRSPRPGGV